MDIEAVVNKVLTSVNELELPIDAQTETVPYEDPEAESLGPLNSILLPHVIKAEGVSTEESEEVDILAGTVGLNGTTIPPENGQVLNDLSPHMLVKDFNTERFPCKVCGTTFKHKSSLVIHFRKHTGERPYKCKQCVSAFRNASALSRHIMTHTGEKPFQCDICGHEFAQKGGLNAHRRTHTGEKPFKCNVCGIAFTWKSNLLQHSRTHTGERPYKCKFCDSAFAEAGNLTAHIRVHTGERPFKCTFCPATFRQGGGLKSHLKTHNRENRFHCEKCPLKFPTNREYKRHMRSHAYDGKIKDIGVNPDYLNEKGTLNPKFYPTLPRLKPDKPAVGLTSVLSSILSKPPIQPVQRVTFTPLLNHAVNSHSTPENAHNIAEPINIDDDNEDVVDLEEDGSNSSAEDSDSDVYSDEEEEVVDDEEDDEYDNEESGILIKTEHNELLEHDYAQKWSVGQSGALSLAEQLQNGQSEYSSVTDTHNAYVSTGMTMPSEEFSIPYAESTEPLTVAMGPVTNIVVKLEPVSKLLDSPYRLSALMSADETEDSQESITTNAVKQEPAGDLDVKVKVEPMDQNEVVVKTEPKIKEEGNDWEISGNRGNVGNQSQSGTFVGGVRIKEEPVDPYFS